MKRDVAPAGTMAFASISILALVDIVRSKLGELEKGGDVAFMRRLDIRLVCRVGPV